MINSYDEKRREGQRTGDELGQSQSAAPNMAFADEFEGIELKKKEEIQDEVVVVC